MEALHFCGIWMVSTEYLFLDNPHDSISPPSLLSFSNSCVYRFSDNIWLQSVASKSSF